MLNALDYLASWIAIACMAFASLWPLSTVKSPAVAMVICSGGAHGKTPGPVPRQFTSAEHSHCHYCCNDQVYPVELFNSKTGAFRTELLYAIASAAHRTAFLYPVRSANRARAPPL